MHNPMLLRIQSEESLRSFIARNIYLNWKNSSAKIFESISRLQLVTDDVKAIANAMGRPGCYGFNSLLHHHTNYPVKSVFKNIQDMAYSGADYTSPYHCLWSTRWESKYCPECVKCDLYGLGYSYWRRSLGKELRVCAKHNVMLVSNCPHCGAPFSFKGHNLSVMWTGCRGRHLGDCVSQLNEDSEELRKSRLYDDIASLNFHISNEAAFVVLLKKFHSVSPENIRYQEEIEKSVEKLKFFVRTPRPNFLNHGQFGDYSNVLIDMIFIAYRNLADFVEDLKSHCHELRSVESLWPTYRSGGYDSAEYVEEDYRYGVGHWSCPYPSPRSSERFSGDEYIRRRPMIYPCCNFAPKVHKGQKLKAERVSPAPPGISIRKRHTVSHKAS